MASSSQTATSGVTCGRPSARTVEIQNSSASSSARRVFSQSVATASWSLNRVSSSVTGCFINFSSFSYGGVLEDRSGDGLPVGSINAVAGSFQLQQSRSRDLCGQRPGRRGEGDAGGRAAG